MRPNYDDTSIPDPFGQFTQFVIDEDRNEYLSCDSDSCTEDLNDHQFYEEEKYQAAWDEIDQDCFALADNHCLGMISQAK